MTTLKHYQVHYLMNGRPTSFQLDSFGQPSPERLEMEVLLHHVHTPTHAVDAPWEDSIGHSESLRLRELGISEIRLENP